MAMNKAELRKEYAKKRLLITDNDRNRLDDLLLIRFQEWVIPKQVQHVLSYWPIGERGEINTFVITDFMAFHIPGLTVSYPVSNFSDFSMQAVEVTEETKFVYNKYGITEPESGTRMDAGFIDLVIMPLLAFDEAGYRLGYGKGFYDRYLPRCRTDIIKLGLSYFGPLPTLPGKDEFDIPLTACITPERIYEF